MNVSKLWLVARMTFLEQLRSKAFIVMTLVLPILLVVASVLPMVLAGRSEPSVVGMVDLAGALDMTVATQSTSAIGLRAYATEGEARAALDAGDITGILVVEPGYMETGDLTYYGPEKPESAVYDEMEAGLRRGLAPDAPQWLYDRLATPAVWSYRDLNTGRTLGSDMERVIWAIAPMVLGILFALMLMMTLSTMGPAIVREKEERSMEMILTAMRPVELVDGKLLGLALLTAAQAAIWVLAAAVILTIYWVRDGAGGFPTLPWQVLVWAALLGVPGYLLYGALAAGLGVMAGGREQARQMTGLLGLVAVSPIWMLSAVLSAPNGSVTVVLSLVPLFSPVLALFRMGMATVPAWQLWAALVILWATAALALGALARIYRAAALLYGQTPGLRSIAQALFGREGQGGAR